MSYIPFDQLLAQPLQYASNNPPFVPHIDLLPEAEPLLVYACSEVANEVSCRAQNSYPRTYIFNLMIQNNWNNEIFADAVQLTCDLAVYMSRTRQGLSPMTALRDASIEVMKLLTASVALGNPDLQRHMSRDQIHDATVNDRTLSDLANQLREMHYQAQRRPMSTGYIRPALPSSGQRTGYGGTPRASHRYGASAAAASAVVRPGSMIQAGQRAQAPVDPRVSRYGQRATPETVARAETTNHTAAPIEQPTTIQQPQEPTTIQGAIETMDRDAHNIIYFGKPFNVPTGPLRRKFEESVEQHESFANGSTKTALTCIITGSIEELAATVRSRRTKALLEDSSLSVYHAYGHLVTPIVSIQDLRAPFSKLRTAATFENVAQVLMSELSGKQGDALRHTLTYVSQIDRILTKAINRFIQITLNQPNIAIDSFIEDIPGFAAWLNTKFSAKYNSAYQQFTKTALACLFKFACEDDENSGVYQFIEDYQEEGISVQPLVESVSMTYISATAKELGYNIDKTHQLLSAKSAPMLHRLMVAVEAMDNRDMRTMSKILVTSDDVHYRVSRVAGETEELFVLAEI